MPINHGSKIYKALCHRQIVYIHRPNLVGASDVEMPQQVRVDFVTRRRLGRPEFTVQRLYRHSLHQSAKPACGQLSSPLTKQAAQHTSTCKRGLEMKLVYSQHKLLISVTDWLWQIVNTASVYIEQIRLPGHC